MVTTSEIAPSFLISSTSAAPLHLVGGSKSHGSPSVTLGIRTILRGTLIEGYPWKLGAHLVIEIRMDVSGYVAIHHGVDEYGSGATPEEAVQDLLTSLADYRAWLEKRQGRLAEQEREALRLLQMILEKQ